MPLAAAPHRPVPLDVVEVVNACGAGDVVLVCEHAAHAIPAEFGHLGLPPALRRSHIAWDPGAREVALHLSRALEAPLVAARISRLVYDCNRPPEAPSAIAARSEHYAVPGNAALGPAARRERVERVYRPFHEAVRDLLDRRAEGRRRTALVTVHSFTPVYLGHTRTVEIGILHDADARLADALIEACRGAGLSGVCRNAPYGPQDGVTHTLRTHALPRGLLNAMIEIRSDLIADREGIALWGGRLATALRAAVPAAGEPA